MNYRKLGNSEIKISPIVLGTWALGGWLWGGTNKNQPESAILASIDHGINCIDTAPAYGFGLSEELVGKAIKGRRDEVIIATKCGLIWDDRPGSTFFFDTTDNNGKHLSVKRCLTKESILKECDASLSRFNIDVIDLYQCHWPHYETPIAETMDALNSLKDQGKIRAFGVSNFSVQQLQQCVDCGGISSNQPKYSLLSREIEDDILPFCYENNIGTLAYSTMEMGLLTGKITMEYHLQDNDTRSSRPWFQPEKRREVLDAIAKLSPMMEKHDATPGQIAAAWIFSQPGVTAALVGARNPEQAVSNARAAQIELSDGDLAFIRKIFTPLRLDEPFDVAKAKR